MEDGIINVAFLCITMDIIYVCIKTKTSAWKDAQQFIKPSLKLSLQNMQASFPCPCHLYLNPIITMYVYNYVYNYI